MATTLQLPAFPRHGILLNTSPSTSPYSHTTSLPGTPHLISSLSSLSSSASSTSPHNSEAEHYFQTYSTFVAASRPSQPSATLSRDNSSKKPGSAPQTRKIRFAPLPEPRRDELSLPDVFLDDSTENLNTFPSQEPVETPRANVNSRPSSLLFSGHADVQAPSSSDITPTTSNLNLQLGASQARSSVAPNAVASSSTSEEDSDWDNITTPLSPNATLSSSVERLPQSCPESPLNRRPDLPGHREKKSLTKKLLKPLFGRNISTEDVLTLGVNQLFRSSTRESDDGMSSGAATPSGPSTPSRGRSKERTSSVSDGECGFGVPLCRSTSDNTAHQKKRKMSFLGFSHGNSSSSDAGLWRTQSGPGDMRRVKSREPDDGKRPRSGSSSEPYGPRKQLRMLNGRVYGAKRSNLAKTNLFATARSEEQEFVEWGYGGMGSVKAAASVGADNKWSRVAGSSAIGQGGSWEKDSRGRPSAPVDPDDDGSGMAWLKKRREQREREKKEAEAKAAAESAEKENLHEQPLEQPADVKSPTVAEEAMQEVEEEAKAAEPEHITTAVTLPAHHRPAHHHSRSMERVPSSASHNIRVPERRDSEDTARAVSPPMSKALLADVEQIVGEMDDEVEGSSRARRESQSSTASSDSSVGTEDEDADVEDSPKDSDREEDDEESEDDEAHRRTALGAGVEKISRHKEKSHSQDGAMAS